MTHFPVLMVVPGDVEDVEAAVRELLIPYKEMGYGSTDPLELKKHLVFEDKEDEYHNGYKTEKVEMFRLPNGELKFHWDDILTEEQKASAVEHPISDYYATFEEYASDWHGREGPDPITGRYGYWHNPNQKWDWYVIGGRWSGQLRGKDFVGNVMRINQLDLAYIDKERFEAAEAFYEQYQRLADGEDFGAFRGPRGQALSLGLVECKNEDELTGNEWKIAAWEHPAQGKTRYDVFHQVELHDILTKYVAAFDPLTTYARLDKDGWQAPGEVGYWGVTTEESAEKLEFIRGHRDWIFSHSEDDYLVVVDCHI